MLVVLASGCALLPSWLHYDIIANDGAFLYIPVAELFLQGRLQEAFLAPQLPLFPLLIAGVSAFTGMDPELSGRMIAAAAFAIAALGLYRLGMLLFRQRWVALLAVLFMITNRELVDCSVDCLKESLLTALIIWGTYHILRWIDEHRAWRLGIGIILLAAAALLRSTALFFIGAWLLLWVFHKRQGLVLRLGIIASPAVIVVALWLVNPHLPIFVRSYNLALIFGPEHTPLFLLAAAGRAANEFLVTGNPVIVLFAVLGLYLQRRSLYGRYLMFVLAIYLFILMLWGFVSGRYLLAPIVCLYPLAAGTVHAAWLYPRRMVKACAGIAVVSCVVLWAYQAQLPPDPDKLAYKAAGQWVLTRIGPDRAIMSNRPRLVFYAKGRLLPLKAMDVGPYPCIAVDIDHKDGQEIKTRMDRAGRRSDAVFRTIHVYLPRP